MKNKSVYIIAGPSGSGKTTFAKMFLPDYVKCPHSVNTDLIAQGLVHLSLALLLLNPLARCVEKRQNCSCFSECGEIV